MLTFLVVMVLGCAGEQGPQGEPGTPGAMGDAGEQGPPGTSCWDLDADGIDDPEEDVNSDGGWDAVDCRGPAGPAISKASVYVVTADADEAPFEVTAWCADDDDILLAGGCTGMDDSGVGLSPQFAFAPVQADDPTAPAGYWCWWSQATSSSYRITATATCFAVDE